MELLDGYYTSYYLRVNPEAGEHLSPKGVVCGVESCAFWQSLMHSKSSSPFHFRCYNLQYLNIVSVVEGFERSTYCFPSSNAFASDELRTNGWVIPASFLLMLRYAFSRRVLT